MSATFLGVGQLGSLGFVQTSVPFDERRVIGLCVWEVQRVNRIRGPWIPQLSNSAQVGGLYLQLCC